MWKNARLTVCSVTIMILPMVFTTLTGSSGKGMMDMAVYITLTEETCEVNQNQILPCGKVKSSSKTPKNLNNSLGPKLMYNVLYFFNNT